MIEDFEIIVDNFAGGGGASVGIEMALGRPADIAINHDPEALAMHAANHPHTKHLCENVWKVDIEKEVAGRKVGLAWFSPDCTHFSKAKGGKPVKKTIRGLAWVALKWAGLVRPRIICLENVEEFKDWGPIVDGQPCKRRKGMTFKRWVTQFRNLGYAVDWRELRACDYGAPTIRKRLFLVARCDGQAINWPAPTHGKGRTAYRTAAECIDWSLPCPSIFLTRKEGRKVGANRPLAEATMTRIAKGVRKYVLESAKPFIVNLTHDGGRIEDLGAPFRTITGAHRGEKAFVTPFLQHVQHSTSPDGTMPVDDPMRTITATPKGGGMAVVMPFLGTYYGANRVGGDRTASTEEPLRTQSTENRHALVSAFLERQFGASTGNSADEPIGTITAGGGGKAALIAATILHNTTDNPATSADQPLKTVTTGNHHALIAAHLAQHNSERKGYKAGRDVDLPISTVTASGTQQQVVATSLMKMRGTNVGQPPDEPLHTISSQGTHFAEVRAFLIKYFGTDQDPRLEEPLHTITSKHRFGLVTVQGEDYVIVDIGMRMLTPRELFRAQGFPEWYIIDRGVRIAAHSQSTDLFNYDVELTKTAQVRMCGNSVSPYPAAALVRAQFFGDSAEVAA